MFSFIPTNAGEEATHEQQPQPSAGPSTALLRQKMAAGRHRVASSQGDRPKPEPEMAIVGSDVAMQSDSAFEPAPPETANAQICAGRVRKRRGSRQRVHESCAAPEADEASSAPPAPAPKTAIPEPARQPAPRPAPKAAAGPSPATASAPTAAAPAATTSPRAQRKGKPPAPGAPAKAPNGAKGAKGAAGQPRSRSGQPAGAGGYSLAEDPYGTEAGVEAAKAEKQRLRDQRQADFERRRRELYMWNRKLREEFEASRTDHSGQTLDGV